MSKLKKKRSTKQIVETAFGALVKPGVEWHSPSHPTRTLDMAIERGERLAKIVEIIEDMNKRYAFRFTSIGPSVRKIYKLAKGA